MISRLVHHYKQDDTEYKMHHSSNENTMQVHNESQWILFDQTFTSMW